MKTVFAVLLAFLSCAWGPALAGEYSVIITVTNATSADVTFEAFDKQCVGTFSENFVVQAGASTNVVVNFKLSDSCLLATKKIGYSQSGNNNNYFGLASKITPPGGWSGTINCLFMDRSDLELLCPISAGSMLTSVQVYTLIPATQIYNLSVSCPAGVPTCPPYNDPNDGNAGNYGFLLSDDSVGVAPPATPGQQPIPAMAPLGSLLLILALAALGALRLRRR